MLQIMASLTDDSRGVIYNHNMFIVKATEVYASNQGTKLLSQSINNGSKCFIVQALEKIGHGWYLSFSGRQ